MAITDIQISEELETGAPSIRYKGKEGPRPPMQSQEEMMIAKQVWDAMGPEEKGQFSNFDEFFRSGVWKQILQQAQQDEMQEQGGIGSLGPRNMDEEVVGIESLRETIYCHLNQRNKEDIYGLTSQRSQETGPIPMEVKLKKLRVV